MLARHFQWQLCCCFFYYFWLHAINTDTHYTPKTQARRCLSPTLCCVYVRRLFYACLIFFSLSPEKYLFRFTHFVHNLQQTLFSEIHKQCKVCVYAIFGSVFCFSSFVSCFSLLVFDTMFFLQYCRMCMMCLSAFDSGSGRINWRRHIQHTNSTLNA